MSKAGWLGICAIACACGAVLRPAEPDRRLTIHTTGTVFESSNGFRFAALPDATAAMLRLDVRYPVGEIDDPPGKEGLAHLVEHLMFDVMIVRDGKRTAVNAELARLAMSSNAETTKDYTHYETYALPGALVPLLALEVDRLAIGCGGLTPAIFAREREVVINELRQRQGASGAALERQLLDAVYPVGHPYRAVDTIESMSRIELKDVCALLAGPYRHGKVDVVVSGAITGDKLRIAAGEHVARVHPRQPATRPPLAVVAPRPGTLHIRADVDEPTLIVTWPLPDRSTRASRLLELVWPLVPYRINGFANEFRWGHDAYAQLLGGGHAPVLAVGVTLTGLGNVDDALASIEKSVAFAVRAQGSERATEDWQDSWQERAESLLAQWETLGGRNQIVADLLDAGTAQASIIGLVEELQKVGPDEVRDLGKEWLAMSRARAIVLEPSGTTGLGALVRTYTANGTGQEAGAEVDLASADVPLMEPVLPDPLGAQHFQLDNGLDVMLWPHGEAGLVYGRLVIGSGTSLDPVGEEGMAALTGASLVFTDGLVFADRRLATRVDDLVGRLTAELRSPGYDLTETGKARLKQRLEMPRAKERAAYERDLLVATYGEGHPYARVGMTVASLDHLHRDAVTNWARRNIVPKNAVLVIAGQFDPALIKSHIAHDADQVAGGTLAGAVETAPAGHADWIAGIVARPSPTVELDLLFPGGSGLDRSHALRLVLAQVLTNQLERLRGTDAITYGMSASYEPRSAGGLWRISGAVDATRAAEGGHQFAAVLDEMRRDKEAYRGAFVLARQKVLENLEGNSSTSSAAAAERLVEMARFSLSDTYREAIAAQVARLTLSDLHAFLRSELPERRAVFGAFGNAAAVKAALTGAGAP